MRCLGVFRGCIDVLLEGIAAMELEGAFIHLDGISDELGQIAADAVQRDPTLGAENVKLRGNERRLGPVTFFWRRGGYTLPITDETMARLIELARRSANPEIATFLKVRDKEGLLLEAWDVGDDEIWVSDRVGEEAVENLRAALGSDLTK